MPKRKVSYHLYPHTVQVQRLEAIFGLHRAFQRCLRRAKTEETPGVRCFKGRRRCPAWEYKIHGDG